MIDTLLASAFTWDGIRQKSPETPVGCDTLDTLGQGKKSKSSLQESFVQLLNNKKAEAYTRIKSGSDGKSIQIGAGSYNDSEWNRLLRRVDTIQGKLHDSTEAAGNKKTGQTEATHHTEDRQERVENAELLLAEFTTAEYASNSPKGEDATYYTYYLPDGIYCRKKGADGFEWQISLEDESQYENGIDIDRAVYSKSINVPDFVNQICYSAEEALRTFRYNPEVKSSGSGHEVIDLNRIDLYYANHPDEIGKRNQYYNGHWYSWAELALIMRQDVERLFSQESGVTKSSPDFDVNFSIGEN